MIRRPPRSTPLSLHDALPIYDIGQGAKRAEERHEARGASSVFNIEKILMLQPGRLTLPYGDRKSTRLNSSHSQISYAVFCLKKKKKKHSEHPHATHSHSAYVT